ncbi:hypothetical protein JCM9140_4101 [Halalkalibacter wakoensis JCM 9140]|uniref:Uncharacterized protein n=1 Tax=Halalkalibacter wakoensis JCM 9140 TaxID=1236970 RepID=W4Q8E9_9BACI|nr:hypothetical protein [Halalkalibacter wakoensis]GAE27933.1 hypothetical protein JCM9140_4101 [Halalkalibacter wakoensis JCM 9140]
MNSWVSLMKKEMRLGLSASLMPIITFFISIGIAAYIGSRHNLASEAVMFVSLMATGLLTFYLIYYMLISLQAEKKQLHLWLHSTMPGYGLLLAKLAAGFLSLLVTLIITGTTLLLTINQATQFSEELQFFNLTKIGMLGGVHLILLAISFACFTIFFWVVHILFNRYIGAFLSLLATLALFVASSSLYNALKSTNIYETLTQWGEIYVTDLTNNISITTNLETGTEVLTEAVSHSFFLGSYLFEAVIVVALFTAACWMLDRKVEV